MADVIRAVMRPPARIHVLRPERRLEPDRAHPPLVHPDFHNYFELAICFEGEMSFVGYAATIQLRAGDAVVVKPGAWHYESYLRTRQPYRVFWMIAAPQLVNSLFTHYCRGRFTTAQLGGLPLLEEVAALRHLAREIEDQPPHWRTQARAILGSLLVGFDRRLRGGTPGPLARDVDPVKHLLYIVQARFREPLQVKALAKEVGLSPDHLSRRFHAASGVTFKEYLNTIRIHHAQILLRSGWTIKRTADECGFNDVFYFTRVFKQRCQLSPGQFVKERIP